LAGFLFPGSLIYAIDTNPGLKRSVSSNQIVIEPRESDFITDSLNLTNLDGILMANALHFVKDKNGFLKKAKKMLKNKGLFLMVEYDTDIPNPWVPYPVSFLKLKELFLDEGYKDIRKLQERKSIYNKGSLYSAIITL
jgi:SAM-dependent methyltransferase